MSLFTTALSILILTVIVLSPIAWACWKYDVEQMQRNKHP